MPVPSRICGKTAHAPSACATQYVILLQALFTWLDKWKNSRYYDVQSQLADKHCQEDELGKSLNKDMSDLNVQKKWEYWKSKQILQLIT